MEPRLFELLKGIEKFGSLRAAAQRTKLSYRHAWAMVRRWSEAFGQPLVTFLAHSLTSRENVIGVYTLIRIARAPVPVALRCGVSLCSLYMRGR